MKHSICRREPLCESKTNKTTNKQTKKKEKEKEKTGTNIIAGSNAKCRPAAMIS